MDVARLRHRLLEWYDGNARRLPWRARARAPDPYGVFVSEVMLQQTRVETVLPRFAAWLERFPDWAALAAADEREVMAAWAGLGYYRRARALHAAARHVVAEGLPHDAAGLRALPGVGPYTAAAVASIAFAEPVAAVDGNVVRVVGRLADVGERVDRAAGRRRIEAEAERLLDPQRPGDWNQAMMDLGATVCTPRPRCGACPLEPDCQARRAGTQEERPIAAPKARPRAQRMRFVLIEEQGRVLVVERGPGLLAGTWMLPGGPLDQPLERAIEEATGGRLVRLAPPARASHAFTHQLWEMEVHPATVAEPTGHWVDPDAPDVALSTACRKAIAAGRTAARAVAAGATADPGAERDRSPGRAAPGGTLRPVGPSPFV